MTVSSTSISAAWDSHELVAVHDVGPAAARGDRLDARPGRRRATRRRPAPPGPRSRRSARCGRPTRRPGTSTSPPSARSSNSVVRVSDLGGAVGEADLHGVAERVAVLLGVVDRHGESASRRRWRSRPATTSKSATRPGPPDRLKPTSSSLAVEGDGAVAEPGGVCRPRAARRCRTSRVGLSPAPPHIWGCDDQVAAEGAVDGVFDRLRHRGAEDGEEADTTPTPTRSAAAVPAVRRGLRTALRRARSPLTPRRRSGRAEHVAGGPGDDRAEQHDADDEHHGTETGPRRCRRRRSMPDSTRPTPAAATPSPATSRHRDAGGAVDRHLPQGGERARPATPATPAPGRRRW